MKLIAILLFLVIPVVILLIAGLMFFPAYIKSSNIEIMVPPEKSNNFPPLGGVDLNLTFTKSDLQDNMYDLLIDVQVGCNQTPDATFAFHKEYQNCSDITTCAIPRNLNFSMTEGLGNSTAYYLGWETSLGFSRQLEKYDAPLFPFDTYETEDIIIALNTQELNSTNKLLLDDCILTATVPTGFTATISDFAQLSNNDTLSELGNSYGSVNYSAWQFRITLIRNTQSLLLLSVYLVCPLIGVWSMFSITQFSIPKSKDRIMVLAGAFMATFAYFLTLRSFAPPTLTWSEIFIIGLMGVWAFLEMIRTLWSALKGDSKIPEQNN